MERLRYLRCPERMAMQFKTWCFEIALRDAELVLPLSRGEIFDQLWDQC